MQAAIHPEYKTTEVSCACGATFETRSTLPSGKLSIDVCSKCHRFYTGNQKLIDTAGRVESFGKKFGSMTDSM